ncbi:MAG: hypothetical protein ACTS8H_02810 [Arsenophonus sp. NC-PE1-MAG3]
MLNPIIHKFQYGQNFVTIETGMIARQATAAVMGEIIRRRCKYISSWNTENSRRQYFATYTC